MVDHVALAIGIVGAPLTFASVLVPVWALHHSRLCRVQDNLTAEQRQIKYRQEQEAAQRKDKAACLGRLLERFDHEGVHTACSQLQAFKAQHAGGGLW